MQPEQSPRFGLVADDLTGANAVAAMAAARGRPAWTALGPRPTAAPPADVRFIAVDAATRDGEAAAAATATVAAFDWLWGLGVPGSAKRIDTTLRGHIGVEVAAARAGPSDLSAVQHQGQRALTSPPSHGERLAVVVPAMPGAGRTARGGHVYLDGRRLSDAVGLPDDATAALRTGAALNVVHLGMAVVRAGLVRLVAELEVAHRRRQVVLCDAETDADIVAIAEAMVQSGLPVLPVDPGPLTLAVAERWLPLDPPIAGHPEFPLPGMPAGERGPAWPSAAGAPSLSRAWSALPAFGPVLAVFGSAEPVARRQVAQAVAAGAVRLLEVSAGAVRSGAVVSTVGQWCAAARPGGPAVGIGIDPAAGPLPDPRQIARFLAAAVREALPVVRPAGLYLSGGAVARAVLDALAADGVRLLGQPLPLAAFGRVTGGRFAGLRVITKGGLAGGDDAVVRCLRALAADVGG